MKFILSLAILLSFLTSALQAVVLSSGQGYAEYNPVTGEVLVSTNGLTYFEITSELNQLIPTNAIPLDSMPTSPANTIIIGDTWTPGIINYFVPLGSLGVDGILDGFTIGVILPTGFGPPGSTIPNVEFMWAAEFAEIGVIFRDPVHIIPEPSSFILAGIAGVGLLAVARRPRTA